MLLKSRLPKLAGDPPTFAAAFCRDLWTPSLAERHSAIRLFDQDRPAFEAGLAEAWRRRDHAGSIASLEVVDAVDGLSLETAGRLWSELLLTQRWEDALRLLEDRRFSRKKQTDYWYDLACARAAARPLVTARVALDRALSLAPAHADARELAAALQRAEAYGEGAQTNEDRGRLVDLLIELCRYKQAAAHLGSLLLMCGQSLSVEEQDRAVDQARTLFRVLGASRTTTLFFGLRPVFTAKGLEEAFEWACEALIACDDPGGKERPDLGEHLGLQVCLAQAFAAQGKWKAATSLFGRAATLQEDQFGCRLELARCVGRAVAEAVKPVFVAHSDRPRVVDVFPFFDELLLLRLKLEEMSPWVDRFVLLEARTSFTGAPKDLVYEQNREAFAPYAEKIVHRVVDFPEWVDSPWAREFYQRDIGLAVLSGFCGPDDLVSFSDVDEIIRKDTLDRFDGEYAGFGMPVYAYFFNLRRISAGQRFYGGVCRAKYFERIGLSLARMGLRRYCRRDKLSNAGWHFSSIKDASGLFAKFRSYSHVSRAKFDRGELDDFLKGIKGRRALEGYQRCEIDDRMPRVLHDNLDKISDYVL